MLGSGGKIRPKNDRGASSFDQRFNSTTSFSYDLPFFKKNYLLGGWNVASIITLTSGQPLNIRYPDNDARLSDGQADFLGNVALRPNLIDPALGAKAPDAVRDYTNYFNRANLAIPNANSPFGNLGRNVVYGFPLYQVDFTVAKSFALTERFKLMFRSEFFNLLNKTNFSAPTVDITSAAFGRVSSTFDPRAVQMALKLSF